MLLHSFEYDDAIDAFREAQRLDPAFAMAYWGEAMSCNQPLWYNENLEKARAALTRLAPSRVARQARAPTAREKAYLDAVERLFGDGDKPARDRAYADGMEALARAYPDDDEAAAFRALALLATIPSGQRNPAVSLRAGAIASAILKRNPQHPGAAHYALHAYDDGEHAAMGLPAARTYARIAPASSHARHMPSHVFLPLGMWDEASASDESAFATSLERVKRLGLSTTQADFHSLGWLQYEYLQQGRFAKARALIDRMQHAPAEIAAGARPQPDSPGAGGSGLHASQAQHHAESEIGRGFGPTSIKSELASMRARLVVESADWAKMKGQGTFDNIDELFALGLASVRLGDPARADAALGHLRTAGATVPDRDARDIATIMAAELDGEARIARGDRQGALSALAEGARLEAKRPLPIARPYPIKPAAELYAETLLRVGDAAGAVAHFQAALSRTPRRAAALIGLARAAHAAKADAVTAKAAREFLAVWHLADADRPELKEARTLLKMSPAVRPSPDRAAVAPVPSAPAASGARRSPG
jgi:tetratricopeptide (TPR) repeat protein